MFDSLFMRCL